MELRCAWVTKDPEYIEYHDKQWGRPVYDARELFAKLCLDGQQAGLSWITILKRTESYHRAYADFDPVRIVQFDEQDVERLMQDTGIIRNRLKVQSIIKTPAPIWRWRPKASTLSIICGASWAAPHRQPAAGQRRHSGDLSGVGCHVQGAQETRLHLRRQHHLLRLHAGGGDGERSSGDLPLSRRVPAGPCAPINWAQGKEKGG